MCKTMSLTRILVLAVLVIDIKGACLPEERNTTTCCQCQQDPPMLRCLGHCPHGFFEADVKCESSETDSFPEIVPNDSALTAISQFSNNPTRKPGETTADSVPTTSSSSTRKEESEASRQPDTEHVLRGGDVSVVSCIRCDPACDDCWGPGPYICSNCAPGYQLIRTTSESERVRQCTKVPAPVNKDKASETVMAVGISIAIVGVGIVVCVKVSVVVRDHCRKSKGRGKQQYDKNDSSEDREDAGNRSSTPSENPESSLECGTKKADDLPPKTPCFTHVNEKSNRLDFVPSGAAGSQHPSLCSETNDNADPPISTDVSPVPSMKQSSRQEDAASTGSKGTASNQSELSKDPAAVFRQRENKITTHITPSYINNRLDDTDSINSSRPISIVSSGYFSDAGDGWGSLSSVTTLHEDEDFPHRFGRSLSVLSGSTHRMKSSSTQTLSSLDNIPLPFIHTCWQYKKEISFSGGFVQKDHSDVRLEVPRGAIERGDYVMVHEAVSVNLQSACAKLPVPENEVIVSPVAEFFAGEGFRFRKPVCIVLPHLLPAGVTERDIHVYQFSCDESGQPQLVTFQYGSSDHPQASNPVTAGSVGTYCFGEGSTVHIFVDHFSGVFCTKCKSDCYLPDLWLELYGQYSHISEMKWEVWLLLKIWDNDIVDFRQDDPDKDSLNLSKMKKIDGKILPALEICGDSDPMREVESTDLSVRLALPSPELLEWMHETRDDGQHGEHHAYSPEETLRLKPFVVCDKHKAKRCQRKDWSLVNRTGDVFTGFIDAGYVRTDGAHADTSRQFIQTPQKITFKVRISPDTLGHNAGDSASGVAKEPYCGSTGQGHDGPNVTSHETQRKFAAGDSEETLRKRVCQTEAFQRGPVSFSNAQNVSIVLQAQSDEGTGYSNMQSPPGREHLSKRSPICVSPSTSSSLSSTPSPGHQGPMTSPAQEQSSSENTQTSLNHSSTATGDEIRRLTFTGQPCEPDSISLSLSYSEA